MPREMLTTRGDRTKRASVELGFLIVAVEHASCSQLCSDDVRRETSGMNWPSSIVTQRAKLPREKYVFVELQL